MLAAGAIVLTACFAGASADVWLRFPGAGPAILFAPYAVVTAALLRTRPRFWWIVLLAASAGDFVPHRLGGASVAFVLMAEVVNHLRAVLAAVGLRRFAGQVKTLRGMVAFLVVAVFAAPGVAALAGASVVAWLEKSPDFWLVCQQWWLSNAITGLILLPLFALDLRKIGDDLPVSVHRAAEALLLVLALVAVGACVFATSHQRSPTHQAHLYWALPFLLWSAVRFGPWGTSATLLAVASLSIWGAIEGRGPFAARSPTENLLELQMFLLAVSIPLLMLAALINEQRRTADALTESQRQYRSVVEDQTEMICRFRPDGTFTFANRAYAEAFGLSSDDRIGGSLWNLVAPYLHWSGSELEIITPASPLATREVKIVMPGGVPRWQQWRYRGLFDEHGVVREYQAVGRDITDRKLADDERRELEARRSVENALRDADRRKDEFLAMLGHELRNPLTPIAVALEILRRAPPGSRETLRARESIGRQLSYITRLLDELLDISRIRLGKIRLQVESVDLGRVIANAVESTRPLIDSSAHELTVRLPDSPVRIRGDTVRLTQVVANLLNNAAKYTERGGRIEVVVDHEEPNVRLSVRDNGIGIAAEALDKIFELYSQIPAGRERAHGGLGIGLALVKRLVELHGGTVSARSEGPKLGSEIVVRLPAEADDRPDHKRPVAAVPEEPPVALRILAVDDNVDVTEGLATVLDMWGHTVRTAHDGVSALEVATAFAPEVVLMDLGLPRVDGLEVARRLRLTAKRAPTLMVSMSGFGQEDTRRRSDEAGFHHHLVKPVDMDSLRSLLEDCVRGRRIQVSG